MEQKTKLATKDVLAKVSDVLRAMRADNEARSAQLAAMRKEMEDKSRELAALRRMIPSYIVQLQARLNQQQDVAQHQQQVLYHAHSAPADDPEDLFCCHEWLATEP